MLTFESLKKEIKNFAEADALETLNSEKNVGFSWEMYFKHKLHAKCSYVLTEKIMAICENEDKTNRVSDVEAIKKVLACLDDVIIKDLQERFFKKHNIKSINFDSKLDQIIKFFYEQLSIDFISLSKEEQMEAMKHEDIVVREKSIFDYLEMTHMQYKYLYQIGSVYL